jgi:hypothetical protein
MPLAEDVAVVVSRGVVVGEEQSVGEEVAVAVLVHKQMARDLRTQQQRRSVTVGEIHLYRWRTQLAAGKTVLLPTVKSPRLATGQQMLQVTPFQRQPQRNRRAMLSQPGRFLVGTSSSRNPNRHQSPKNLLRPHPLNSMNQLYHNLR